jgi:hypothetical protein
LVTPFEVDEEAAKMSGKLAAEFIGTFTPSRSALAAKR